MTEKFQNKYRIPSARLPNWDYGRNAAYFVTICTQNREHYFGDITETQDIENPLKLQMSKIGKLAEKYWLEIPHHFPFVILGSYVIMPNHVHGIVIINKPDDERDGEWDGERNGEPDVETLHATSLPPTQSPTSKPTSPPINQKNKTMASISPKPGTLSTIIRSYKSAITKNARQFHNDFAWQSRFHDHIIRNENSLQRISDYIESNILHWNNDTFNNTATE